MNTKDKIAVMQAFERGEKVELRSTREGSGNSWEPCIIPLWNWASWEYRIKPEPRYLNVYEGNGVKAYWYSCKASLEMSRCRLCIGYLEDKQDGSVPVFHPL